MQRFLIIGLLCLSSPALAHLASWYGSQDSGGIWTATGERYNENALTAAHRTLKMGTKVLVTHKKNGRSVVVRINDRGPFTRGRSIDLSKAAARELGMLTQGVADVSLRILSTGDLRPVHTGKFAAVNAKRVPGVRQLAKKVRVTEMVLPRNSIPSW